MGAGILLPNLSVSENANVLSQGSLRQQPRLNEAIEKSMMGSFIFDLQARYEWVARDFPVIEAGIYIPLSGEYCASICHSLIRSMDISRARANART